MARALIERGFTRVRPLEGGLEAWIAAGFPVEVVVEVEEPRFSGTGPLPTLP